MKVSKRRIFFSKNGMESRSSDPTLLLAAPAAGCQRDVVGGIVQRHKSRWLNSYDPTRFNDLVYVRRSSLECIKFCLHQNCNNYGQCMRPFMEPIENFFSRSGGPFSINRTQCMVCWAPKMKRGKIERMASRALPAALSLPSKKSIKR